jgi:hypothetical protein
VGVKNMQVCETCFHQVYNNKKVVDTIKTSLLQNNYLRKH